MGYFQKNAFAVFNSINNSSLYIDKKPKTRVKKKIVVKVKKPIVVKKRPKIEEKSVISKITEKEIKIPPKKIRPISFRDLTVKYPNFNLIYFSDNRSLLKPIKIVSIIQNARARYYLAINLNYNNRSLKYPDILDRYYEYQRRNDFEKIMLEVQFLIYEKPKWQTIESEGFKAWIEWFPNNVDRLCSIEKNKRHIKDPIAVKRGKDQYYSKISEFRLQNLMNIMESLGYWDYNVSALREHGESLKKSMDLDIVKDFITHMPGNNDNDQMIIIDQDYDSDYLAYLNEKANEINTEL